MSLEREKISSNEALSEAYGKAREIAKQPRNWKKIIGIAVGAVVAITVFGMFSSQFGGGEVRNCIRSVLGSKPDCNDGPGGDGNRKETFINVKGVRRSIGMCRYVEVDGSCIE